MDFSKLDQNEKTAAMASAALVIAGLFAAATYSTYAMTWLAVIAALAMLFVVLQPQIASGVNPPGSKGSLMLVLGVAAGAIMVLSLIATFSFVFLRFGLPDLFFLIAVAAGIALAWTGWQEFQSEGGTFQLGAPKSSPAVVPHGASAPAASSESPPTPVDTAPAESAPTPASEADAEEDRPHGP